MSGGSTMPMVVVGGVKMVQNKPAIQQAVFLYQVSVNFTRL